MVARPMFDCPAQVDPHDWECSNCCVEQDPASPPWCAEDGSQVCAGCIASRFQHALDSPTEWPARWGPDNLNVEHYRRILGDELYNAYVAKAAALAPAPPSEPDLPDGCTWGVQVQWCPGCKKVGGLESGCNHIVCEACHTNFCFLCRKEAHDRSDHWRQGGCPRYNHTDSPNAIYDEEPDDDPTFDEAREEEDVRLVSGMLNWNTAMQTSDLATQDLLRRFLDRDNRPRITGQDMHRAMAAMSTNHALTGIRDVDWLRAVNTHRQESFHLLDTLLAIRDTNDIRHPQGDLPETNIFARTAPLFGLLRQPITREFNMGAPESRNAASSWMVAYLHDNSVPRVFGAPSQANSAILHGVAPHIVTEQVVVVFELHHPRFRAEPLTGTSMVLTIQGDVFEGEDARNVTVGGLAHTFRQLLIDVAQD